MTDDELLALIAEIFAEDDEPAWSEPPLDAQLYELARARQFGSGDPPDRVPGRDAVRSRRRPVSFLTPPAGRGQHRPQLIAGARGRCKP